jgi:predicted  nucleic acid-binding Zn-ribbon protein
MSGCVNCVWDLYRDEMEEWAAASREARRRLNERGTGLMRAGERTPAHVATSMDDDGRGSESNWDGSGGLEQEDLFGGIPVGIREFMRTEKRLKEKHRKADRNAGS